MPAPSLFSNKILLALKGQVDFRSLISSKSTNEIEPF
jgi:hypothetical protein